MIHCNLCNVAFNNVQHTFVWANIAEDYDMCFECQEMNGDVAQQHSLVLMTLVQRTNGLFAPEAPPPNFLQPPAPFVPGPDNSPFAVFGLPSAPAPVPDPLFYKCWDHGDNVTLKMVTPGNHDEFLKIMKDHKRMERIDRDAALEEGFQVPLLHSDMVKPLFRAVRKRDRVQITDFEDLTGASGICIGVDTGDGIVKLDHTSEIKIVPLENLVAVE